MNFPTQLAKLSFTATLRRETLALSHIIHGAGATLAQTKAYVTNNSDNTVSVIDTGTNTVIATVPVGLNPSGIAVTPNGSLPTWRTKVATLSL